MATAERPFRGKPARSSPTRRQRSNAVYCEVGTEYLNIIETNIRLRKLNYNMKQRYSNMYSQYTAFYWATPILYHDRLH
jgi:hypothetical protein